MIKVVAALMCIVAAAPLVAALIGFVLETLNRRAASYWLAVAGSTVAMTASVVLMTIVSNPMLLPQDASRIELFQWLQVGESARFDVTMTLRVDSFAALLVLMITAIGTAVLIHGKQQKLSRQVQHFPSLMLSLFVAIMVVLSANFVMLYFFWQLSTVAAILAQNRGSRSADDASPAKSNLFLCLVIADFALLLGVCFVWTNFGTLELSEVLTEANIAGVLADRPAVVGTICFCFFLAAFGRTAQFPLFVWLHDADRSRPADSALIQTATLMPAGIYLVLRSHLLFDAAPDTRLVMAMVCAFSILLLSSMAITQKNMTRVLSLSSAMMLGQAFLALSIGTFDAIKAAIVLLIVHSLTKAVLFLSADNIASDCDETTEFERLGSLRRRFPKSWWAMICALVILVSGIWGTSRILQNLSSDLSAKTTAVVNDGDEDLNLKDPPAATVASVAGTLSNLILASVFLHSLAVFRAFFLVFHGGNAEKTTKPGPSHESAGSRWVPLFALLVSAAAVVVFAQTNSFDEILLRSFWSAESVETGSFLRPAMLVALCSAMGFVIAWMLYVKPSVWPDRIARVAGPFSRLSQHGFYVEEFYCSFLARMIRQLAGLCRWFDRLLFHGHASRACDHAASAIARAVRPLHTGNVQLYVLALLLMIALLAITLLCNLE